MASPSVSEAADAISEVEKNKITEEIFMAEHRLEGPPPAAGGGSTVGCAWNEALSSRGTGRGEPRCRLPVACGCKPGVSRATCVAAELPANQVFSEGARAGGAARSMNCQATVNSK